VAVLLLAGLATLLHPVGSAPAAPASPAHAWAAEVSPALAEMAGDVAAAERRPSAAAGTELAHRVSQARRLAPAPDPRWQAVWTQAVSAVADASDALRTGDLPTATGYLTVAGDILVAVGVDIRGARGGA
jgi:hypothetical protein